MSGQRRFIVVEFDRAHSFTQLHSIIVNIITVAAAAADRRLTLRHHHLHNIDNYNFYYPDDVAQLCANVYEA